MARWHLAIIAVLVFGALYVGDASAQPPRMVSELMSEPLTLWDWGMYNAQNAIQAADQAGKLRIWIGQPNPTHTYGSWSPKLVTIWYDWQKNKMIAQAVYGFDADKVSPAGAKQLCKNALRQLRQFFLIDPDTGKRWGPGESGSIFRQWFGHNGYHLKGDPEKGLDGLEQITEVQAAAVIFRDGVAAHDERVACRGPLLSTKAFCSP